MVISGRLLTDELYAYLEPTADDIYPALPLRTLNFGNYGISLNTHQA